MPSVSGNDRGVRLRGAFSTTLKLFNSPVENLSLRFLAFRITLVEMLGQTPCFRLFFRFKQFDDGPRRIHPAGRVNSRSDAEAQIVGSHLAVVTTTGDIDQRAQYRVYSARQIRQTQRDNRAILAQKLRDVGDCADGYHL